MAETSFNVLISSAGRRVALLRTFREALEDLGLGGEVLAVDISELSSAFQLADRSWTVPRCTDEAFIPAMLALCERERVGLVIPTIDTALAAWAAHRERFEAIGTAVAISSPETVAIAADKHSTHRWLTAEGLPTVRQGTPEEVLADRASWPFPLIAKPVGGSCSIGVHLVVSVEELVTVTRSEPYIVQSVAPGVEYTVSVLVDRGGRAVCAVPRERLAVRAGEVSKGRTVREPELIALASTVAERLPGAFGALNVQIFRDATTGEMNIIEVNPRFGGGYPLACRAGAHYSRWLIEEAMGLPSTARGDLWRDGLVMLRYDDAVFVEPDALSR
ncbi:MAG: ATP-grasp domain-containing protein [Myxococcota bacterium]|jgi:carbamoyl-phosphate synthase large subunit|nr:ATP-grasp domain-containing protein [Myxococcota bacterium]